MGIEFGEAEIAEREKVMDAVLAAIRRGETIPLTDDPAAGPFLGRVGAFRYRFEGEDDLLHLSVERADGAPCSPEDGLAVARFLMPDLPAGLCWLKPGHFSQHLYLGHDDLLHAEP